ncbi:MAG: SAM-dependent methyltransferase, partial [Acidimicrobiales bacterium]
ALTISGLAAERFCFEGFLPRKGGERAKRLAALAAEQRTTVLYEAPRRVVATLSDLAAACGSERRIAVGRELTKLHEESWTASLGEAVQRVTDAEGEPRGEWVLVLEGAAPTPVGAAVGDAEILGALELELVEGVSRRAAITAVTERLKVGRRRVYELAHLSPETGDARTEGASSAAERVIAPAEARPPVR